MTLISDTIPNLVNGISQQAPQLRLPSQAAEQVNGWSSLVRGQGKRPPSRVIRRLTPPPATRPFIHMIDRDDGERYVVQIGYGQIRVYDARTGFEIPVAIADETALAYLQTADPQRDFRAVTVAKNTFVVNTSMIVMPGPALSPARPDEAILWFRQGAYSTAYKIFVGDDGASHEFAYTTMDSSNAAHADDIRTDWIAAKIKDAMDADPVFSAAYEIGQFGSSLYIRRIDGGAFTLASSDGNGDSMLKVAKGVVQRFSDLPARGVDGFTVQVRGDAASGFDDYWVSYAGGASANDGVWKESLKPGEAIHLAWGTMPHVLERLPDGGFLFGAAAWIGREVGDLQSNPLPSIYTEDEEDPRRINDITFHRNRLVLLAGENIVMSRAGAPFSLCRETVTQVLDTDPIDIAVAHPDVTLIERAVPFDDTLLLFAGRQQFVLTGDEMLTPRTAAIIPTTAFECQLGAKPVRIGSKVYFAFNRGNRRSGVREYFLDPDTLQKDAADVTAHVPAYIPGNLVALVGNATLDTLVALSGDERRSLYIYQSYWTGGEKLQSAWHRWAFGADTIILGLAFLGTALTLVAERPDGLWLEAIELDEDAADWPLLDRRLTRAQCSVFYDDLADRTLIGLPYEMNGQSFQAVVRRRGPAAAQRAGAVLNTRVEDSSTLSVPGDHRATDFMVGRQYAHRYGFSPILIRQPTGSGMQAIADARLLLRTLFIRYEAGGYLRAEVSLKGRGTFTRLMTARTLGDPGSPIGQPAFPGGELQVPIQSEAANAAITLVNDSPFPCHLLSARWEGLYHPRARRI